MGNGAAFLNGERSENTSEYVAISQAQTVGGVRGKIIKKRGDSDTHTDLPKYAATSDVYFRQNAYGVCQARAYVGHKMCIDFDWSHQHINPDGKRFNKGTVHVQIWKQNSDGSFIRLSVGARYMNNAEMKKYGGLIKKFCPYVRFR